MASNFHCWDDEATASCQCGGSLDCNPGVGVCVEPDAYPEATRGPSAGDIDHGCAPNDGPAFTIRLGGLGTCPVDEAQIVVTFDQPLAPGLHRFSPTAVTPEGRGTVSMGETQIPVAAAEVILDAIEDGVAHGSYKVWIAQETWFVGTMDLDVCDTDPQCG